ncbi:basic helix-loop-helix protein [Coemansia sp. RSA 1933]|nr:basic helix-loop-helix protein [Coemansia sp. RSA 1933]
MSAQGSSSVLLSVEDRDTMTNRNASEAKYPNIAPKSPGSNSGNAETGSESPNGRAGLTAIAPATESRVDGTPLMASFASGSEMETSTPKRRSRTARDSLPKPGTDEWHRQRRDSHKEVERRRREVINQGIDQLAELIPGAERNKGKIIAQAVEYVSRLRATEEKNIEKWTIEKLLADQAIAELSAQVDQLKSENKKLKSKLSKNKKSDEDDASSENNGEGNMDSAAESRKTSKRRSPEEDEEDIEMSAGEDEEESGGEEADDGTPPPAGRSSSSQKKSSKSSSKKKSQKKKRKGSSKSSA